MQRTDENRSSLNMGLMVYTDASPGQELPINTLAGFLPVVIDSFAKIPGLVIVSEEERLPPGPRRFVTELTTYQ